MSDEYNQLRAELDAAQKRAALADQLESQFAELVGKVRNLAPHTSHMPGALNYIRRQMGRAALADELAAALREFSEAMNNGGKTKAFSRALVTTKAALAKYDQAVKP